jgi:uncharacterized alpha-E superfamily protein
VLLSRVAESMYWTGRYIERAESTARIVKVHTEQFLGLPKAAGLGWAPLLAVTGTDEAFARLHGPATEERVVSFLVADPANPGSVVSSLVRARENVRATQAVFPRDAWEALNRLVLDATEGAGGAVARPGRRPWAVEVVAGCQRFAGTLAGTMSHDAAHHFLLIGRQIERADMTTRVLDVRAGTLPQGPAGEVRPYDDLAWTSVLRSLSADQMYRRSGGRPAEGADIVRFLLQDRQFPRSVEHCLVEIGRCLLELPRHDAAMKVCAALVDALGDDHVEGLAAAGLHDYVDALQLQLVELHGALRTTWFPAVATGQDGHRNPAVPVPAPSSPEMLATA